jgi:hypothetical protein
MPDKMSLTIAVLWKREKEGWTIESVLLAKLCELFRCRLFAQDRDRRIAWHKLNQKCYERDDGPNNQQQNKQASQDAEGFSHSGA